MKIAVCDDEQNIRESIKELLEQINGQSFKKSSGELSGQNCRNQPGGSSPKAGSGAVDEILLFSDGQKLLAEDVLSFDIIFLDIEMGGHGGLDAAKEIRKRQKIGGGDIWGSFPLIIFVTGYREHMPEAFAVHAFGYAVKPMDRENFEKLYREAAAECRKMENRRGEIIIKNGEKCQKISLNDVVYIESSGRKNVIHMLGDRGEISYYGALREVETELPDYFFRTHKGYIVNMKMIRQYSRSQIDLADGSVILISKYRYADFVAAYMEFLR